MELASPANSEVGNWGTDYLLRATTAWHGLSWAGLEFPADAIYPISTKDSNGNDYNGAEHKYVLRFAKGRFPPVKGFWSLSMYHEDNFLAANPLNRYTLSQQGKFVTNQDGSVVCLFQPTHRAKPRKPLAAGTKREIRHHASALLADGNAAFDSRRHLEATRNQSRPINRDAQQTSTVQPEPDTNCWR